MPNLLITKGITSLCDGEIVSSEMASPALGGTNSKPDTASRVLLIEVEDQV
jgi:hypothetical protein